MKFIIIYIFLMRGYTSVIMWKFKVIKPTVFSLNWNKLEQLI